MSKTHGPMGGTVLGEKPKDTKGTALRLFSFMKPFRLGLVMVLLLTVLSTLANNFGPRVLGFATNEIQTGAQRILAGTGGIDFSIITVILLVLAGLYLVGGLLTYFQNLLMSDISQKTMYILRKRVDQKLKKLPLNYFDTNSFGDILSRVTNDVDTVSNSLQQGINQLLTSVLTIVTILVMMLVISPVLTLIALVTLPLTALLSVAIVKRSQNLFRGQQKSLGDLLGHIEEMYTGHNVVKAYGREDKAIATFEEINEERYKYSWKANFVSGIIMPASNLISNLGYVIVTVIGALMIISGRLMVGDIQSFVQYLRNFSMPITQLSNIANTLQSAIAAAERIFQFLDEPEESPAPAAPATIPQMHGEVDFKHVHFSYNPDNILINDFNLSVKQGETIAIVGPTGAGKTTLVNLLLRFYDIMGGKITIDGVNIAQMDRLYLREMFGMVLQDTWLFKGSILENIRYGRLDATDEEVYKAAEMARADDFINALPDGYNMQLVEDAANISQGQRQLLTIARAILSDPKILILDEATSSVDTRTELLIQEAMLNLMQGRTSFVIAHRLSTIKDASKILVLNQGDVIEIGTHKELLDKGGFYADLYNSQFAYNNA